MAMGNLRKHCIGWGLVVLSVSIIVIGSRSSATSSAGSNSAPGIAELLESGDQKLVTQVLEPTSVVSFQLSANESGRSNRPLRRLGDNGHVYLLIESESSLPHIIEFDSSGTRLRQIDVGSHPLLGRLNVDASKVFWTDMVVDRQGVVYLSGIAYAISPSQRSANFILMFDKTGVPLKGIDTRYYHNLKLALDERGSLYVYGEVDSNRADLEENYAIRKYNPSGELVKKLGLNGNLFRGRGSFVSLTTLSVRNGHIYLFTPETGCISDIDESTGIIQSARVLPRPPRLSVKQLDDAGMLKDPSRSIPLVEQRPIFVGPLKNGYFLAAIMETAYDPVQEKSLTVNYCLIFRLSGNQLSVVSVLHGIPATNLQPTTIADLAGFRVKPKPTADREASYEFECRTFVLREDKLVGR